MKILHFITRLILGGAQENTILSCEGSRREGHEVTLAYGPIEGPEGSLLKRAASGGYDCVPLSHMVRPVSPRTDWRGYRECRDLIQRLGPDVVHTHSSKAGILGRAAAWAENVPAVIHTVHGLPFHPHQPAAVRRVYIAAERWAARRCHRIVCVADAMARQALAVKVGRREQYRTVFSGIEIDKFLECRVDRAALRRELGLGADDLVIGTVARLADLKGHDDLLEALEPLLKEDAQVKLLWVGDGRRRRELEQRIEKLSLRQRVAITGMVPPARVPALMHVMDILVHPSYHEGLPRVLPQAWLCGLPVVSYDCDGAGEVFIDGVTGRLVPTGDRKALGEAVRWTIQHRQKCRRMALDSQDRCVRRFDASFMVGQLHRLYREVLETRSKGKTT